MKETLRGQKLETIFVYYKGFSTSLFIHLGSVTIENLKEREKKF